MISKTIKKYSLHKTVTQIHKKQSIASLCRIGWYVNENMTISRLTELLSNEKNIPAVGVVNDSGYAIGIIETSTLFASMGRQYGWVILGKKKVSEFSISVLRFNNKQNIFNVAESLEKNLNDKEIAYFLLEDSKGSYQGLFSSKDMLLHLSEMTKNDIAMAHRLQQKIANKKFSIHQTTFDLIASTESAKGLGGDYYYAKSYEKDKWIIAICDVSGKGVAASLLTTTIWGMMSIFNFKKGLPSFLKCVNKYIFQTFDAEKFITGIFIDFNALTGEIKICDMGHSFIFLSRKNKVKQLELNGNMPIGVTKDCYDFKISKTILKTGDYLFLPTDGLLEQENGNKELYDISRINKIIEMNKHKPIEKISNSICKDFNNFKKGEYLHDDVTFILLKYYEANDDFN